MLLQDCSKKVRAIKSQRYMRQRVSPFAAQREILRQTFSHNFAKREASLLILLKHVLIVFIIKLEAEV